MNNRDTTMIQKIMLGRIAISIQILSCLGCCFCCYIIIKYLTSKPLGLQTLLDKFILDFVKAYLFTVIVLNLLFYCMAEVIMRELFALIGLCASSIAWKLTFSVLTATIIIRYLNIFHPAVIEFKITDAQVIKRARIAYLFITT